MYLGIDVGSVSTDIVIIDNGVNVLSSAYIRTSGSPIDAVKEGLKIVKGKFLKKYRKEPIIRGVGTTGSGRKLAGVLVNADVVKNEITAHAVATSFEIPEVKTIFEIGGQDSKIIIIRDGVPVDFGMNTVCAAGTGSFLDHQAERLGIPIEKFGKYALMARAPARIAGRCTVFAESDMIHKMQLGYSKEDIIAGLSDALVQNYLSNVGRGKEILPRVVFQGGVAANIGIKKAFEKELGYEVIVPKNHKLMGAIGAAMLAKEEMEKDGKITGFKGFNVINTNFETKSFICGECPNNCEIVQIIENGKPIASWGSICGKWDL